MSGFLVVEVPHPLCLNCEFDIYGEAVTVRSIFHPERTLSQFEILVGRILSGQMVWGPFCGGKAVLLPGRPDIKDPVVLQMTRELEKHLRKQETSADGGQS